MGKAKRDSKKNQHKAYQMENRVVKNKIAKTKKHIKKFPNDQKAVEFLKQLEVGNWKPRTKPLVPGSNKPDWARIDFVLEGEYKAVETAGEQLSRLLGIELPHPKRVSKPKITHKKRR